MLYEVITNLVNIIKKRIVIRTDESIRKSEEEARKIISEYVPEEAKLQGTVFDTATGEVSIEAKRPWLLQRNSTEFNHAEVTEKTGWKIRIRKATTVPSRTIQTIKATLKQSSAERRITSYNVCYTKLLRPIFTLSKSASQIFLRILRIVKC